MWLPTVSSFLFLQDFKTQRLAGKNSQALIPTLGTDPCGGPFGICLDNQALGPLLHMEMGVESPGCLSFLSGLGEALCVTTIMFSLVTQALAAWRSPKGQAA